MNTPSELSACPPLGPRSDLDSWGDSRGGDAPSSDVPLLPDIGPLPADLQSRLDVSRTALPEVGTTFHGFTLLAELGRGAFGRVFLAQQGELANRLVALKVSAETRAESQKLAQLQHTHIVPVYSFHQAGPLQAVCMPYFGSATLSDVLSDLQNREAMPRSGQGLVSTLQERRSRTAYQARSTTRLMGSEPAPIAPSAVAARTAGPPEEAVVPAPANPVGLRQLEGLTYAEAVLWIGARLADGLAHAHERGILHRDLKPANILMTDDGQPMLLDFNLAEDVKHAGGATAALIGGTLPYMSPEHLRAFRGETTTVDHRSDVYALGLILVELLLGRHPFTRHPGAVDAALPKMITERQLGPARHPVLRDLRKLNPAVTPAIRAILWRCLEADPEKRYPTARALQEDLERQLSHQPLKHTAEPSLVERSRKFMRRNPWLTSATTLAVASAATIVALTVAFVVRGQAVEHHEAQWSRHLLKADDLPKARVLLPAVTGDRAQLAEGEEHVRSALARYKALDGADPVFSTALTADERAEVRDGLAELLYHFADSRRDPAEALALNDRAARWFGDGNVPRALHLQRAALLDRLGRAQDAAAARDRAAASPIRNAWEQALVAREQMRLGEVEQAQKALLEVVRKDPGNVAAWYMLGNATFEATAHRAGQQGDALAAYSAALALAPGFYPLYLNRGLVYYRERRYPEAEVDFDHAVRLRPDVAEAYLHRAQARDGQKDRKAHALADLDEAIRRGLDRHLAFAMRARLRTEAGDAAGAAADREEVLKREPRDEEGHVLRGIARLDKGDLDGARADFEAAARLGPRSVTAQHNLAFLLSEKLDRPAEAVAVLDRLLRTYPNLATDYTFRGLLHARLGDAAKARRDARKAVELDATGETSYRAACVYARLAALPAMPDGLADQPARDKDEAVRLLANALKRGFGLDLVDRDPDLAALKDDPRRDEVVAAARLLRQRSASRPRG